MTIRKLMSLCILSAAITTGFVQAERFYFAGAGNDNTWTNANNWICKSNPEKSDVPGDADDANIRGGGVLKITSAVTVGYMRNGYDGGGTAKVLIDGGSLLTVGTDRFNSACYKCPASLTVQNGGSATFNSRLMVGYDNTPGGSVILHDGTIRVADTYYHNNEYTGTEILNSRTTINPGGVLDVDDLVLNAGVMDIAGGTLIIRRNIAFELDQWIANGRLIAMGGEPGWKIKATLDAATGWTTVVAEFTPKPLTVGRLKPVVSFPLAG